MWVNSLKDYAKIKSDLELALSLLSSGANVETAHAPNLDVYMSATRELILPVC